MKHGVDTVEVVSGPTPILDVSSAIAGVFGTSQKANIGSIIKTLSFDEAKEKLGEGTLLDSLERIYKYAERATVISYVLPPPIDSNPRASKGNTKRLVAPPQEQSDLAIVNAASAEENEAAQAQIRLEQAKAADPELGFFLDSLPLIRQTQAVYGFMPKIFLAPGIMDKEGAAQQAISAIRKTRGMWIVEPPAGSTQEQAKLFSKAISDYRAVCYYPRLKVLNNEGVTALDWAAPSYAGLIIQMDKNLTGEPIETGYWCSPSNLKLVDAVASEHDFEYLPNDADCEVNQLNASGIVTTINFNGLRAFGNRSTAYPSKSDVMTFTAWRRTMDMIEESIEKFAMQYLDRPMFTSPDDLANTLIGRVAESVNDYLRAKIGESLVYAECFIKQEQNPLTNLMQGKIKFHYKATPAMVMESIEFEAEIYSKGLEEALSQLLGGNS